MDNRQPGVPGVLLASAVARRGVAQEGIAYHSEAWRVLDASAMDSTAVRPCCCQSPILAPYSSAETGLGATAGCRWGASAFTIPLEHTDLRTEVFGNTVEVGSHRVALRRLDGTYVRAEEIKFDHRLGRGTGVSEGLCEPPDAVLNPRGPHGFQHPE